MLCQICIWVVLSELTSVGERRKWGLIEQDVTCLAVTVDGPSECWNRGGGTKPLYSLMTNY